MCLGEVCNHVYRDVLPVPAWNRVGVKWCGSCLPVNFGLLTGGAPFDVVDNVVSKGAPVVRALYFFDGFGLSRVTS